MQIIAPDYYKDFKCIAQNCKHSCCIGWEIDIDKDTLEIYKNLKGEWNKRIEKSISYDGEAPHFITDENGRCPFLNQNGLCDIITEFGEDGLCQICYDHPRFRNFFNNRVEIGLGLCCEAAAELILNNTNNPSLVVLEDDGENQLPTEKEITAFNNREALFNLFYSKDLSIKEIIQKAADIYNISLCDSGFASLVQKYRSLERLDNAWDEYLNKAEQKCYDFEFILSNAEEKIPLPSRNLLCYFTYRYFATEAINENAQGAVNFILHSTLFCLAVTLTYYGDLNAKCFADICRMFSLETEYSEENIEILLN